MRSRTWRPDERNSDHDHERPGARPARASLSSRRRDLTRRYGEGDTAVDALRGVSLDVRARPADGRHGPVGLRQVHAHAHPRRARPADERRRHDRGHQPHDAQRHRADEAAPEAHRIRLPVLQPAPDAERRGERRPAALDRRREARQGVGRRAARAGRPVATGEAIDRRSSPAASSSASRSAARS